jgi:hypothetical protein
MAVLVNCYTQAPAQSLYFNLNFTSILMTQHKVELPVCPVCGRPVPLEAARVDENGRAMHEDCYLLKLQLKHATGETKS